MIAGIAALSARLNKHMQVLAKYAQLGKGWGVRGEREREGKGRLYGREERARGD